MFRRARLLFTVLVVLAGGLQLAQAQAGRPERGPAALRVDGEEIPLDAYARWLVKNFGERTARTFALDFWAIELEAGAQGVAVSEEEIAKSVDAAIQERIENPLSRLILDGSFGPKDHVKVGVAKGQLSFTKG